MSHDFGRTSSQLQVAQHCDKDSPCTKSNSECIRGACYCVSGYRAVNLIGGKGCVRVSCHENGKCDVTRAACINGMCTCPDLTAPEGTSCFGASQISAADVQKPLRLVGISLSMAFGLIVFSCVVVTCMKSREDYVATESDDKVADDEGALMAAKRIQEAIQESNQPPGPPPEESVAKIFLRSVFPKKLSDGLFGIHGDDQHISFGNSEVSGSSIDV